MSDNRDADTGQFTPVETPVGREAAEIDAGYIPYKDPEKKEEPGDDLTPREAAEQIAEMCEEVSPTPEAEVRTYSALDNLPENTSFTLEQMANIVADERVAMEKEAEQAEIEETRRWQDELRDVKPEAEPTKTDAKDDPKFKEAVAIEAANHAKVADEVKQRYSAAIENADQVASAAFRARFPELAAHPADQWQNILSMMPQERAQEAIGTIQQLVQVKTALQQQQARQAEAERTRFRAANDSLEEKIKDWPKERRAASESEIVVLLQENGSDLKGAADFLRSIQGSDVAMALLMELGDTRAQLKAIRNAPKAIANRRSVPPVQRPGASAPRVTGAHSDLAAAKAASDRDPSPKNLAKLLTAMRQARG